MRELASDPREFPAYGGLASPDFRAFCRGSRAGCKRFGFPQATRLPLQWALQATRLPLQWALQAIRLPLQRFLQATRLSAALTVAVAIFRFRASKKSLTKSEPSGYKGVSSPRLK